MNDSIWYDSYGRAPVDKNTRSYVIFQNSSQPSSDPRSAYHGVDFPLLVLQKSIEQAMLQQLYDYSADHRGAQRRNVSYSASYAELWSFQPEASAVETSNTTSCGAVTKDMTVASIVLPLVVSCVFMFVALLGFQVASEEGHRGLYKSLRTLGLFGTAYWTAWLLFFQLLILVSSGLGTLVAAIMQPSVFILRHMDLTVVFLLLWLGQSCSLANAMFLGAFVSPGNMSTGVVTFNFVAVLVTLGVMNIGSLNRFGELTVLDAAGQSVEQCLCEGSLYNVSNATDIVKFLYFWMPWFHIGRVLSEALSVVQYGQAFTMASLPSVQTLYAMDWMTFTYLPFQSTSVSSSFNYMVGSVFVYTLLAWFCCQLREGVPLSVILVPSLVRQYMLGLNNPIAEGDVRGAEKARSERDQSIRAYKVSKTYKTVHHDQRLDADDASSIVRAFQN